MVMVNEWCLKLVYEVHKFHLNMNNEKYFEIRFSSN